MEYELTVQETSRQKEFSFYNIFWIFVAGGALYSAFEGKYGKQLRTDFSERLHNGGNV